MSANKVHDPVGDPESKPANNSSVPAPRNPSELSPGVSLLPPRGFSELPPAISMRPPRDTSDAPPPMSIRRVFENLDAETVRTVEHWRGVLRQDPTHAEARASLKRIYRGAASWVPLLDLFRTEIETLPAERAGEKLPLLRQMAELYQTCVHNDLAYASVLAQIVALDPTDIDALRTMVALYERLGRWRDLLSSQSKLAELEFEPEVRAELYRAIAVRWLDQFSNVQNAVDAYERLHRVTPKDLDAITKLKELYNRRRSYKPLYELLVEETAEMAPGPERRAVWMDMAKLAAERLDRGADAIRLYEQVLEEEPAHKTALDSVEKQAERDKNYPTLARVLERRITQTPGVNEQLAWLQKLGILYAERLQDHAASMGAWRRVLDLQPSHPKALRVLRDSLLASGDYDALTELYGARKDWDGLGDVLSTAADKATDEAVKIDLSYRAATVYTDALELPDRAVKSHERILSIRPDDLRAVTALIPLVEQDHKWARLPALYEVLLRHIEPVDEQLSLLVKLVAVTGERLHDYAASFSFAQRAYVLIPDSPDTLSMLERSAKGAGAWEGFARSVEARVAELDRTSDERRMLVQKLAAVYATELGRIDDAVAIYRELVEGDDTHEAAVPPFDRLLRAADRREDLRWLFEVRAKRAGMDDRMALLQEWATLEEESFGAPTHAINLYRQILGIDPTRREALRALVRLLKAGGDMAEAAAVLERECEVTDGNIRIARQLELALLYLGSLQRASDALETTRRVLEAIPNDSSAIVIAEKLLDDPETRVQAASLLEAVYGSSGKAARQAEMIEVQIAAMASGEEARLELLTRLANVQEEKLHSGDAASEVLLRAAREYPHELSLWEHLMVLAVRPARAQALADTIIAMLPPTGDTALSPDVELYLARMTVALFNEKLGQIDRAVPYLERILARDAEDIPAFDLLKQILTTRERWQELERLYEERVQFADSATQKKGFLLEMAVIAGDITADHAKAIGYYERILVIDPTFDHALRALDHLYTIEERWDALTTLIESRLESATGPEANELKLRLADVLLSHLNAPARAFDLLTEVLDNDPDSQLARDHLETLLTVPDLRASVASVLEHVYTMHDDFVELARILLIRLESANESAEKAVLYRRIAELRSERLYDDAGAFDALVRLVPLDPHDELARTHLIALGRKLKLYDQTVNVLTDTAAEAPSPSPQIGILFQLARFYEDPMVDRAGPERTYQQILGIEGAEPQLLVGAARSLGKIYASAQRILELTHMLRLELSLEDDERIRQDLFARLGELTESVLGDPKEAVAVWRTRLAEDGEDQAALTALDRLYEQLGEHQALIEVLQVRERLELDSAARRALALRIGHIFANSLDNVSEAIRVYRSVLEDYGPDRPTLTALEKILERDKRWPELAETIEIDLSVVDSLPDQTALLARLGSLRFSHLADLPGAIEAYRQAVMLDPSHATSRAALEAMLTDGRVARDAAGILGPLFEAEADATRFLITLDIEIEALDLPTERLPLLERAVLVAETNLNDPQRALDYSLRGLKESVQEDEFPSWLTRAVRLASVTNRSLDLLNQLSEVVTQVTDAEREFSITVKLAEIARTHASEKERARDFYLRALELRPDDDDSLAALERIYQEAGDAAALLDIVKRRTDLTEDPERRKEFLSKQADLYEHAVRDPAGAIGAYEHRLDLGQDDATVTALTRLYTQVERWNDLVSLYERRLTQPLAPERAADVHFHLGETFHLRMADVERAFDEYSIALQLVFDHAATVRTLEGFVAGGPHVAAAALLLEPLYLAKTEWSKLISTLEARLAETTDVTERRPLLERLSRLLEEQNQDVRGALEATARLFADDIGDEAVVKGLERLAKSAGAEARLAQIYGVALESVTTDEPATARVAERTGELLEAQGEHERALAFYRRAYAFAPSESPTAFDAIDRLLRRAGRHDELIALYRDSLAYRDDAERQLSAYHRIATIQSTDMGDDEGAIATHKAALEADGQDVQSLDALTTLYTKLERWKDLADLTRVRASQGQRPEDEAAYRISLGKLLEVRFGDGQGAIDEYQAVLDLVPDGSASRHAAVEALEGLLQQAEYKLRVVEILRPVYETGDDWRNVINVHEERLALTEGSSDRASILKEIAQLWESRGNDRGLAFDAVAKAFMLDPEDGETRSELDRLALATGRWDDLAVTYDKATAHADGPVLRDLIQSLAQLHDVRRGDLNAALESWVRLYHLDETDIEPLDAMDEFAVMLGRWGLLVDLLLKKAEFAPAEDVRALSWQRIGDIRRDMLSDDAGAVEAYDHSLDIDSENIHVLDRLITLIEAKRDAARLVDLYRRRGELCGEAESERKYELLIAGAACYDEGLGDHREAIRLLTEALELKPKDRTSTLKLEALFTLEKMWPDLLDNLRSQVEFTESTATVLDLKKRIGALLAGPLEDTHEALVAYREVLQQGPFDESAASALRAIGERAEELRLDVATILEPVYRAAGRQADVADVLELRLRDDGEPQERAAILSTLAGIYETALNDTVRAEDAYLRALVEVPTEVAYHQEVERLAGAMGNGEGWQRYAQLLSERAEKTLDADVASDLLVRLGRVAEEPLKDVERAVEAYALALDRGGDRVPGLEALDRLYARQNDPPRLADTLERRIAITTAPEAKAALYVRLGSLQQTELGDRRAALGSYRDALATMPDDTDSRRAVEQFLDDNALFEEAFEVLEGVYRSLGLGDGLAKLFARRIARASDPQDRVRARLDLARVLETEAGDRVGAQRAVEGALADVPDDPDCLAELERLAAATGQWKDAERTLAAVLEQDPPSDIAIVNPAELWVTLATWRRDHLLDKAGAEAAFSRALTHDPENLEVVRSLEGLLRSADRTSELVALLRRRAVLESNLDTKRTLLREAMTISYEKLKDFALVEAILGELITENDADIWALEQMSRLRETQERYADMVTLLLRRAELAINEADSRRLKHEAAIVLTDKVNDKDRAIATYEDLLEGMPGDAEAVGRLRGLYVETGRQSDLVKLLRRLVDFETQRDVRSTLRLEIARLEDETLGSPRDAADTLRAILDDDPGSADAVVVLSQLLEKTGQDEELAELLNSQIERAHQSNDLAAELTLQVRLGEVFAGRLKDIPRALSTYEAVLERNPSHRGALEAVAQLSESSGTWDRAAQALSKLLDVGTRAEGAAFALRLANASDALGDVDGVERALKRGCASDPANTEVRARLETFYETNKKWRELADLLVENADALSANPASRTSVPAPAYTLGSSLPPPPLEPATAEKVQLLRRAADIHVKERNAPADAAPILEKAVALAPFERELFLALADAYTAGQKEKEAAAMLEKVIASYGSKRTKELSFYHHRLGHVFASLGDQAAALNQFDTAFKINPSSLLILKDLATLAFNMGDLDKAQKTFRALLVHKFDSTSEISKADVFYYLGEVSTKQGDKVKAQQMFERALENEPAHPRAKTRLAEIKG